MATTPKILVIEGHDGAGKTTLGAMLARELGGRHVRPFGGTLGALQLWCGERGEVAFTSELARHAIEWTIDQNRDAGVLVFDRHWMTVCTLLPEAMWGQWQPHPPTALCVATLETTLARLSTRDEPPESEGAHRRYMERYRVMERRYGAEVIATDGTIDESFARMLAWAKGALAG